MLLANLRKIGRFLEKQCELLFFKSKIAVFLHLFGENNSKNLHIGDRFDLQEVSADDDQSSKLKSLNGLLGPSYTQFGQKVMGSDDLDADCDAILELLKSKGPAAIEIEVTGLAPEGGGSGELMLKFLQLLLSVLKSRKNFEAAQAYLGLFLKLHSDVVLESPVLIEALAELEAEQKRCWSDLKGQLNASSALVAFYKSSLVA
jgi:U3 small nucleolar RNA-associated protein 21